MENMNNQGKTDKQLEDSTKFAGYSILGMIILIVIATLFSSCSTTKKCCDKEHVITEWDGDRQINWYSSTEEK